jgi:hypothetical protein
MGLLALAEKGYVPSDIWTRLKQAQAALTASQRKEEVESCKAEQLRSRYPAIDQFFRSKGCTAGA